MKRDSDAAFFTFVAVALAVLMLAAIAMGGCVSGSAALQGAPASFAATTEPAAPRGPILIRVRIVDTDPSDDVVLSFVFLCSRVVKLMRGEGVQQ